LTTEKARRIGRSILAKALLGENPQLRRQELRAIPNLNDFVREAGAPTRRCCGFISCRRSAEWPWMKSPPSTSSL
jgi:hypothetical protein